MQMDNEKADAKKLGEAIQRLQNGDKAAAEAMLRDVCSRCPDEYQYEYTSGGTRYMKFWDMEEFKDYVEAHGRQNEEDIVWILSVYPRACYHLAYVLVEKRDFRSAISWLNKGQGMEPRNPKFLLELGVAYAHMKEHQKSHDYYQQAYKLASDSEHDRAVALRGMGVQLIDLQCLDEAEARLRQSLELDPENGLAKHELVYIAKLRSDRQVQKQKPKYIFWK